MLRALLLLALLACASATPCAPGRENSVDGATVSTDTVNAAGVVISGCNNTVTRVTVSPSAQVAITGSDDVLELNVGATQVTVTGDFNSVKGNDVSQSGGHSITVSGEDNVLE